MSLLRRRADVRRVRAARVGRGAARRDHRGRAGRGRSGTSRSRILDEQRRGTGSRAPARARYTEGAWTRGRAGFAGSLLLSIAALLAASCGSDPDEPVALDVRVAYVSRLPAGCPDAGNICYPMCAHHNAPSGLQAIVPLWGADTLRLTRDVDGTLRGGPGRRADEHAAAPVRARHRGVLRRRLRLPAGPGGHPAERDEADEGGPRRAAGAARRRRSSSP